MLSAELVPLLCSLYSLLPSYCSSQSLGTFQQAAIVYLHLHPLFILHSQIVPFVVPFEYHNTQLFALLSSQLHFQHCSVHAGADLPSLSCCAFIWTAMTKRAGLNPVYSNQSKQECRAPCCYAILWQSPMAKGTAASASLAPLKFSTADNVKNCTF